MPGDTTVSLPDLYTTTQRFFGIEPRSSFATTQSLRPGGNQPKSGNEVKGLYQNLSAYMRLRQMVWEEQAAKQRIPTRSSTSLHRLEVECAAGMRALKPELFQRFDEKQLMRILRSAPVCNFAKDTWLFSRDPKEEADPPAANYYFIVQGSVDLYERSPKVSADAVRLFPGDTFAEGGWPKAENTVKYRGAGAQAMSTVLIVVLTKSSSGQACGDDRLIADRKYANILRAMQIFNEIPAQRLEKWLEVAQIFSVPAGSELLTWDQISDSFLVMTAGSFQWTADVTLVEVQNPESQITRRKINIFCEVAIGLSGGSIFDKIHPYLECKLSPQKKFATRKMMNGGKEPHFNHHGMLVYDGEDGLEFTVYNYNQHTTADVIGNGFIPASAFTGAGGFEGEVQLTKPASTSIWQTQSKVNEPAGILLVQVTFGNVLGFRSVTKHVEPRRRTFPQQNLLELGPKSMFGHEPILLGDSFFTNLRRATGPLGFDLTLSNFAIVAKQEGARMSKSTCLRIPRKAFEAFLNRANKQKDMLTEAVNSSLEKQIKLREVCHLLIHKWNEEDHRREQQKSLNARDPSTVGMDVNSIRAKLRGAVLHVRIASALGLGGGAKLTDKLDPYLVIKIVGTTQVQKSSVFQDCGANPIFDFDTRFRYNGETVVDITVWDKDLHNKDAIIGSTSLSIEQFHDGFVGALEIKRPATLSKNAGSAGTLNVELEWSDIPGM